MTQIELFGFAAAILTSISYLPQAVLIIRTGETAGISLVMYAMLTLGKICWLSYGILVMSVPVDLFADFHIDARFHHPDDDGAESTATRRDLGRHHGLHDPARLCRRYPDLALLRTASLARHPDAADGRYQLAHVFGFPRSVSPSGSFTA